MFATKILKAFFAAAVAVSLSAFAASAADFKVRDFGAAGDGAVKDTAALQQAIDACAAGGGGRVVLADGTFLSGALRMKSGVELHIDRTARLLASPDITDFPDWPDGHARRENLPRARSAAFIFADVPANPSVLEGEEEMIDLVPYGATMLRLGVFPDNTKMTDK